MAPTSSTSHPLAQLSPPPHPRVLVVSLKKRPRRRAALLARLRETGIAAAFGVEFIDAFDGQTLLPNPRAALAAMGWTPGDPWRDPVSGEGLTLGEVGCAVSHHAAWERIARRNMSWALILEDDVLLEDDALATTNALLAELGGLGGSGASDGGSGEGGGVGSSSDTSGNRNWDMCYLGRHSRHADVANVSATLVRPDFSYWLVAYLVSSRGARRLLDGGLKDAIIPVDEYVPFLFGCTLKAFPKDPIWNHWRRHFQNSNTAAASDPTLASSSTSASTSSLTSASTSSSTSSLTSASTSSPRLEALAVRTAIASQRSYSESDTLSSATIDEPDVVGVRVAGAGIPPANGLYVKLAPDGVSDTTRYASVWVNPARRKKGQGRQQEKGGDKGDEKETGEAVLFELTRARMRKDQRFYWLLHAKSRQSLWQQDLVLERATVLYGSRSDRRTVPLHGWLDERYGKLPAPTMSPVLLSTPPSRQGALKGDTSTPLPKVAAAVRGMRRKVGRALRALGRIQEAEAVESGDSG
jgi:GR25 family glycosyltransferase involved in LPS biosynthesis